MVAAYFLWLCAVAWFAIFILYPRIAAPWVLVAAQVATYALIIAPIIVWSRPTLATLRTSKPQLAVGITLIVAALVYSFSVSGSLQVLALSAIALAAVGIGEELAFRGLLWEQLERVGLRGAQLIVPTMVLFIAWHLVSMSKYGIDPVNLAVIALLGVVFGVLRKWLGNTGFVAMLHMAIDVASTAQ